ncbi:MAG: hypothetical protein AAF383_05000 [Cyanobacteria bacterium P01_A01_bin.83]
MHEDLRGVSEHMKELGLAALAHAIQHTVFFNYTNSFWGDLAILQAAHACEILIKACIAKEHPLLIFDQLPKSTKVNDQLLDLRALVESGKTIQYQELPERLWATTGYRIKNVELYREFGKLRNGIQHFASPYDRTYLSDRNLEFIFGVIDPLINDFWGLYAVDFHEEDKNEPIFNYLIQNKVTFFFPDEYKQDIETLKQNPL